MEQAELLVVRYENCGVARAGVLNMCGWINRLLIVSCPTSLAAKEAISAWKHGLSASLVVMKHQYCEREKPGGLETRDAQEHL